MKKDEERIAREFERMVVEHHVRLRAFVRSLGVVPDWVDDVAQEAFLAAYQGWDTFDPSRDFGRWIRAIALNIVRNEMRKEARRRRILHTDLTDMLLRSTKESQQPHDSPAIDAISKCLGLLAPKAKAVVLGKYRDNESVDQLAERHGITAVNIRQILMRSRRSIGQCVQEQIGLQGGPA
jgi:RNA polymerase sigma-70 factor (ECF subfamily)